MRAEHKESFRTWATLVVSTGALVVTSLRQPLAWTLRSAVQDVLHEELAKYGTLSNLEVGREKRFVSETETLNRMEHEMGFLREQAATAEATRKLLENMSNCVCSIERKLEHLAPATNDTERPPDAGY